MKNYSAILEMYHGNRGNLETIKLTEDEINTSKKVCKIEEELVEKIKNNKELLEVYKRFEDASSTLNMLNVENSFVEGFRFGVLLAFDVLN